MPFMVIIMYTVQQSFRTISVWDVPGMQNWLKKRPGLRLKRLPAPEFIGHFLHVLLLYVMSAGAGRMKDSEKHRNCLR